MKNYIKVLFLALVSSSALFISCNKATTVAAPQTIESRLANDPVFKNVLTAAANLGTRLDVESLSNDKNITELESIATRINNKTATTQDYTRIQEITGESYDNFILDLKTFALSLNDLNKKYPEFSKMKPEDISASVTKAIKMNPSLQSFVNNPAGAVMRTASCPLRDLCNLAVTLVKIFAGDAICTAISVSTIPVVGGLLCTVILTLGANILTGICNALPC